MLHPIDSIDYLFIRSFCEEDKNFDMDLPLMLQDFFIHEREHILEYSAYVYADDSFANSGALSGLRYKFLNLLLAAARHNSAYAAEMLCRIYKIYYRKEYNQLKRFKTLSYRELEAFETGEELFATISARILTVAPFMGIDVSPECVLAQDEIEEILEDHSYGYKTEPDWIEFKEGLVPQAKEDSKAILKRFKKQDRNWYFNNRVQKFIWKVFQYHGVSSDFDLLCEAHFESDEREFTITLSLLRTIWPHKDFSDEEVEFFRAIYRAYTIFIEHLIYLDEDIDLMLGREDKFSFELENSLYRPKSKKAVEVAHFQIGGGNAGGETKLKDNRTGTSDNQNGSFAAESEHLNCQAAAKQSSDEKDPYIEIEHLRASLRAKDQTIQQLNRLYRETAEREKQNRVDQESMESDREELIKLREALYQLTQEDLKAASISQEEMEAGISSRRIVIVGGHDNWVSFLKEKFPEWVYIKPGISNTVPESAVMHAEYLFFFTDTLSHGAYNKFLNTVRTHHIPFGYLHGTNIPMTVRQIYAAICETD